jgi:hypothetical protein
LCGDKSVLDDDEESSVRAENHAGWRGFVAGVRTLIGAKRNGILRLVVRTLPVCVSLAFVGLARTKPQTFALVGIALGVLALEAWVWSARRDAAAAGEGLLLAVGLWAALAVMEWGFTTWPRFLPPRVLSDTPGGELLLQDTFLYDRPALWGLRFRPLLRRQFCTDLGDPAIFGGWGVSHIARASPSLSCGTFVTDEDGFLNAPSAQNAPFGTVVAGDSFLMATRQTTWVARLGELTSTATLSLGVPQWGTAQEVLAVRLYGLPRRPRLVVLAFFGGNDLTDAVSYERRLATGMSWREIALGQMRSSTGSHLSPLLPIVGLLAQEAKAWVGDRILNRRPTPVYPLRVEVAGRPLGLVFYDPYVSILTAGQAELEGSANFRLVADRLRLFAADVSTAGAAALVVYIPPKEQVYLPLLLGERSVVRALEGCPVLGRNSKGELSPLGAAATASALARTIDDQPRVLERAARALQMDFLDLTGPLRQAAAAGAELYNAVDTHWNDAGHDLAARAVAAHIARRRGHWRGVTRHRAIPNANRDRRH